MRVWVDMTAAAHPLVLRPLISGIEAAGGRVAVSAREYGQTLGILERLGISYSSFGRHGGAGAVRKGLAVAARSGRLARWARGQGFDLALAHGSVDAAVVATLLRIPLVQMQDYEHAGLQRRLAFRAAELVLAPEAIPVEAMERAGARRDRLHRYPGLKEDYYLADFEPDPGVLEALGLNELGVGGDRAADGRVLAVVRPPPETSAYHASNPLYEGVIDRVLADSRAVAVLIPRTASQARRARARGDARLVVPERAVDAQSLIAYADLVISAGGTMNREAVALGTPVYTIFSGRMGAVDAGLVASGRLRELRDAADLELMPRSGPAGVQHPRDPAPLVEAILGCARRGSRR